MNREETKDFLECRRSYYASLSTDPNPYVKATKVCGYTLAESSNACLMAIKALEQESYEDKIKALGEDLRKMQASITDEKSLCGFNMAVALCNKHLGSGN